jgi:Fe-S-cluster containining protein
VSRLDLLYAQVPTISSCTGACATSCGPIAFSDEEAARILSRMRGLPEPDDHGTCSMLNVFGRCDIYNDRPMICRMWGAVERMPCVYGCEPDGPVLDDAQARAMLGAVMNG